MNARRGHIMALAAVLTCCLAASCGGGHGRGDARSGRLVAALAAADDSLAANSPCAPAMLKAGMDSAADSLEYYDWYLRMIRYQVQRGLPDTMQLGWGRAYDFLAARPRTPRVDGMMAALLNTKGSYYYKLHLEPAKAISAYSEAYARLFGSDTEKRLPDVCANLADAYVAANDMPHAALWYRRALVLADSLNLPAADYVSLYMGLGRIYTNLGDFDLAAQCYATADSSFSLMPLNMKLYFLTNYGNYYYYTGDYASSLKVFRRMEKTIADNGLGKDYDLYLCLINMADLYLNLDMPQKALQALDPAEAYFTKIGDETAIYYAHTIRMGLGMKSGDTATVSRILAGERLTAPIDFNIVNIRQRYLRDYYVRRGDYEAAYRNLSDSIVRNDSLKHNLVNMRASEIMMRYAQDTLRLHYEMDMQAKDADIRTARLWIYVGVLLIVALALTLLYGFTFSRKRRLQLMMQLMQLRLLNVRSRISPHFIFNVLNRRVAKASPEDAADLVALVKLIRANLNMSGKDFVQLKEELDFVRSYVAIERASLGEEFSFEINTPPDSVLDGVQVPSMFVQILVENAIKHGLKGRSGPKRLRVDVAVEDAVCRITVTDNGAGFDIRRSDPSSTKTGMKVIRNTIGMINHGNKRKIRLGVRNIAGPDGATAGCEVTLTVPQGLRSVLPD